MVQQAVIIAVISFVVGSLLAMGAAGALAAQVPLQLTPARFMSTFVGLVVADRITTLAARLLEVRSQ